MKFVGIIPARYSSSRFPGKPLALLDDKMVIEHVYTQVKKILNEVYVATDDFRIYDAVKSFGGKVVMTKKDHKSGTDRICEALNFIKGKYDIVINIQGDEPFIQPEQIQTLMNCFEDKATDIATLGKQFKSLTALRNSNSPKIVIDVNSFAMYFSRSIIPFIRGKEETEWINTFPFLKHIGLYAYKTEVLKAISKLPQSSLEIAESLEQLRWLQNGYKVKVGFTDVETIGIDTPSDLKEAEKYIKDKIK